MKIFQVYCSEYPQAITARERLLLIDRLIHAFHYSMRHQRMHAPVDANLIEGDLAQVMAFLNELTYGDNTAPQLLETRQEWQGTLGKVAQTFPFIREKLDNGRSAANVHNQPDH